MNDLPCGCPRGMKFHAMNCPVRPSQEQAADDWRTVREHLALFGNQAVTPKQINETLAALDIDPDMGIGELRELIRQFASR